MLFLVLNWFSNRLLLHQSSFIRSSGQMMVSPCLTLHVIVGLLGILSSHYLLPRQFLHVVSRLCLLCALLFLLWFFTFCIYICSTINKVFFLSSSSLQHWVYMMMTGLVISLVVVSIPSLVLVSSLMISWSPTRPRNKSLFLARVLETRIMPCPITLLLVLMVDGYSYSHLLRQLECYQDWKQNCVSRAYRAHRTAHFTQPCQDHGLKCRPAHKCVVPC